MLTFYHKYKDPGKYSQNAEWGILKECLRRIDPENKTAIEFGAPSFYYCSNIAQLEEEGWKIRMYDINENIDVRVKRAEITPDNINDIIGGNCEVLSIDIDNNDYHVWKAYKYKPAIVIIEINSSIPPTVDEIPGNRGASYKSMMELAINKGYFLVAHTGNMIFVWNKYKKHFPEITGYPITDHELYFNTSYL